MNPPKTQRKGLEMTPNYASENYINRIQADWQKAAKEAVEVEFIRGTYYGKCSELAALRLANHYGNPGKTRAYYSDNRKTWFFCLDVSV